MRLSEGGRAGKGETLLRALKLVLRFSKLEKVAYYHMNHVKWAGYPKLKRGTQLFLVMPHLELMSLGLGDGPSFCRNICLGKIIQLGIQSIQLKPKTVHNSKVSRQGQRKMHKLTRIWPYFSLPLRT